MVESGELVITGGAGKADATRFSTPWGSRHATEKGGTPDSFPIHPVPPRHGSLVPRLGHWGFSGTDPIGRTDRCTPYWKPTKAQGRRLPMNDPNNFTVAEWVHALERGGWKGRKGGLRNGREPAPGAEAMTAST